MSSADQYRVLREGAGVFDASAARGRLWLTGSDRRAYLQGLLTNDIVALTPGSGCYSAYLTAQGRMIADMRIFELGDALLADLDSTVTASVRDNWTKFVFSEDVQIEDRSGGTSEVGVYGPRASHVLAAALVPDQLSPPPLSRDVLDSMPVHGCATVLFQGAPAIVLRSEEAGVPGFEVVIPAEARGVFTTRLLTHGGVAVDMDAVEVCRVEAGRPRFGIDMTPETIPLEAGIEDRAISLTKGCYVGQEVIIRVLHRGQGRVARRLVGLVLAPDADIPRPGAAIASGERSVGAVTSAVRSPALERAIALGYVHRDFTAPGTTLGIGGTVATVATVPFV